MIKFRHSNYWRWDDFVSYKKLSAISSGDLRCQLIQKMTQIILLTNELTQQASSRDGEENRFENMQNAA